MAVSGPRSPPGGQLYCAVSFFSENLVVLTDWSIAILERLPPSSFGKAVVLS